VRSAGGDGSGRRSPCDPAGQQAKGVGRGRGSAGRSREQPGTHRHPESGWGLNMGNATPLRVLLVEDDPEDADIFCRYVAASTVYSIEVDRASTSGQACQRLAEGPYDVVFLDLRLGEPVTGVEMFRRLTGQGSAPAVIVLTGAGDQRTAVELMKAGAADYLPKDSFTVKVLERSIRYALEQRRLTEERNRTEEALRRSEERYRVVTEESLTSIFIIQEDRLQYVNPRVLEQTGYSGEQLLGRSALEFVRSQDRPQARELLERMLAGETVEQAEVRIQRQDGETLWARVNGTCIDYRGRPAVLVNAVDITQEKHLEQQLLQTEKLTAIGELVSGVAHELNNPLTAVLGYAQLAQSLPVEGELAEYLRQIGQQANRAGAIVSNLLTFARKKEPERELLDLNTIVESCVELRECDLSVSNITVVRELAEGLPAVLADFQQIQQVVVNLINNADYAIRQHQRCGAITLRTSTLTKQEKPWVRLEVMDDGPGIPETYLGRIFDPFFTTKPPGQGTGLGLSVSYGIVLSHQGSIYAENRPERGACFVVELPAAATPSPRRPRSPAATPSVAPARVLVVEDEEAVARMLERLLSGDGHRVTVASDGVYGLARLGEEQFDLVIIDLRMPRMSGPQLYERLGAQFPELVKRVVFVTGDVLSPETARFLQDVKASVLAKPFTIDEARRVFYQKLKEVRP